MKRIPFLLSIMRVFSFMLSAQSQEPSCLSGDCYNGFGKCKYILPYEMTYEGNFVNGQWEGNGTLEITGNLVYKGTFTQHSATGKGTITYVSGDIYTGDVVNLGLSGTGTYTYKSGEKLSGTFRDNNIWSGTGFLPISEDINYIGSFENGQQQGAGKYVFKNGKIFTGQFNNGKIVSGEGYLNDKTSGLIYEGKFANGMYNGAGKLHLANGDIYIGTLTDGEITGYGTYTTASGDSFTGTFTKGMLNGSGSAVYKNGNKYTGNFQNSVYSGYGEASYSDGVYKGYWVDGKRQGTGKYYNTSGTLMFDGEWNNGEAQQKQTTTYVSDYDTFKSVFAKAYKGFQTVSLWGQEGRIDLYVNFNLYSDMSIGGTLSASIVIDNVRYTNKVRISGYFNKDTQSLNFHTTSVDSQDKLPGDLYWTEGKYNSTIYNNSDHNGYFLIKGTETINNASFEISDY